MGNIYIYIYLVKGFINQQTQKVSSSSFLSNDFSKALHGLGSAAGDHCPAAFGADCLGKDLEAKKFKGWGVLLEVFDMFDVYRCSLSSCNNMYIYMCVCVLYFFCKHHHACSSRYFYCLFCLINVGSCLGITRHEVLEFF